AITGHAKFLSADQAKAFELLRLALAKPRFDQADITRMRTEFIGAIREQFGSPDWQGRNALLKEVFAGHPYSMRRLGSEKSLNAITRDDIKGFAAEHLARSNLVVAVAGDIKPDDLAAMLDQVFGALPAEAKLMPVTDAPWPATPTHVVVTREGTQTGLLFAWRGPKRSDPDWYALEVANYVIGGGGFASRLMHEVREKRGLTYGIDTHLSAMEHAGMIAGDAAIDNNKVAESWRVAHETIRDFYDNGITQAEMTAAKDYLTGAMPMAMTSTDKAASAMLGLQLEHLGPHFFDDYPGIIHALTLEQINQAIRRWYDPDAISFSMVGKPEGIADATYKPMVRE
ncbi:MAG: insulinase family protein, partial [Alphaproteobacteria bacterium]|nr:insulinase family protein [Alphaproteobacteria bacterium]